MDIEAAMDAAEAPAEAVEAPAEAEAEEVDAAEGEPAEPTETTETPDEPEKPRSTWDDTLPEDAFTPEALSKPEGVQAAAQLVEEKRVALFRKSRELDGRDIRYKQRDEKWKQTRAQHLSEQENFRALAQEFHATVSMARNGSAAQRIDALGRLFGGDGRKIYEELSIGILRDGKPVKKTPEVEALEAQVAEMKQMFAQQQEWAQRQQLEAERARQQNYIQEWRQGVATRASDAQQFPALAHFAALGRTQEIVDYAAQLKEEHFAQTNFVLDDNEMLTRIERELAATVPQRPAQPATSLGTPQKPGAQAQRTPGQRSVTPSAASRSGGATRQLTDEERLEELARDPDFVSSLFGG